MRCLRLHAAGDLRLHDEPAPVPGPGEELVRVAAVGVCGSDVHWFAEGGIGDARLTGPLVLGHELAGITSGGRRVAVDPAVACGTCELCLAGDPNLCLALRFAGHADCDGALREYLSWPARLLFTLPDELSYADGAMLEPLGVAIHAVDLAHLRPSMSVGVFGCGPIGLLVVGLARLCGATRIVAADRMSHRLDAARAHGATDLVQAGTDDELAEVALATRGRGVDVAFEVAGENAAVESAVSAARPGGKVLLVGIPADDRTSFRASTARRKGLSIKLVRRMKHSYPRAIRLVQQGLVDVRSMVTHRFPLEHATEAFRVAERREGVKAIIEI